MILIIFLFSMAGYGQGTEDKLYIIIDSLKIVKMLKLNFIEYRLKPLQHEAAGADSIKLIEMEKHLSDKEIRKKITECFNEVFTEEEINELYDFISSSAFHKLVNSSLAITRISKKFEAINAELDRIAININKKKNQEQSGYEFKPVPVDREDGVYATVDYNSGADVNDIILEETPAITTKDMLEAEKNTDAYGNTYIDITLTENGAEKLYLLTVYNISKPLAIVINKHIVSLPVVQSAISAGKVRIDEHLSDQQIENIISRIRNY